MKKLNEMSEIEMKLSTAFYSQTDRQKKRINQELEQYSRIYTAIKSLLFKVNYRLELRMDFEIKKKGKNVKAKEFVKEIKKIYKEAKVVLKKS